MATVQTQIRIDAGVKKQANELFDELGMDMSSAVNIFLRQCILRGGLPFKVKVPQYSAKLIDAANEAKRISRDPDVPGYTSMEDLKKALEEQMLLNVKFTTAYKKSYRLMKKRGLDLSLLDDVINTLRQGKMLEKNTMIIN